MEALWLDEATRGAVEETLSRAPSAAGLLCDAPQPVHARRCVLRALLRSLRLWHGARLSPLLTELQETGCAQEAQLCAVVDAVSALAQSTRRGAQGAEAYFASSPHALSPGHCDACARHPPHAPSSHLAAPTVCAAAAAAAALFGDAARWRAALERLPPHAAATAACLCLTLHHGRCPEDRCAGSPVREDHSEGSSSSSSSEDEEHGAHDWPTRGWLAHCIQRRLRLGACEDEEDCVNAAAWRALPAWLLAAACESSCALCRAYVGALLRCRKRPRDCDALGEGEVRDAALRLRCVLAAGPTARKTARRAMRAWGCAVAAP